MPIVFIPALLRRLTGGQETVQVAAGTVGQLIDELDARFPGLKNRLCTGDELRPGLAVAINTQLAQGGLADTVPETAEVHFVPAISGG